MLVNLVILLFLVGITIDLSALIKEIKGLRYKGRTTGVIIEIEEVKCWIEYSFSYSMTAIYQYTVDGQVYKEKFHCTEKKTGEYQLHQEDIIRYDIKNPANFIPNTCTKYSFGYIYSLVVMLIYF